MQKTHYGSILSTWFYYSLITDEIGYTIWPQPSDLLEDMYLQNMKFYEGWTESLSQLVLNAIAMGSLGIESPIQYFSLALSFVTLTKCLADRILYLKQFSTIFLINLLEVIFMFLLCLLGYVFQLLTNNDTIPAWLALSLAATILYPIIWFTLMKFTRLISNMSLHHIFAIYWILYFGLSYLFNFVSFVK